MNRRFKTFSSEILHCASAYRILSETLIPMLTTRVLRSIFQLEKNPNKAEIYIKLLE